MSDSVMVSDTTRLMNSRTSHSDFGFGTDDRHWGGPTAVSPGVQGRRSRSGNLAFGLDGGFSRRPWRRADRCCLVADRFGQRPAQNPVSAKRVTLAGQGYELYWGDQFEDDVLVVIEEAAVD
jgi:hypothetical protein